MLCMRPRPRPRCNRIWSKCSALIFRHGVSAVAVVRLWQLMSIRHRSTLFQLACRPGTPGHVIRSGSPHMMRPISVPAVFSSGLNSLSRQALGPHRPSQVQGTFKALKGGEPEAGWDDLPGSCATGFSATSHEPSPALLGLGSPSCPPKPLGFPVTRSPLEHIKSRRSRRRLNRRLRRETIEAVLPRFSAHQVLDCAVPARVHLSQEGSNSLDIPIEPLPLGQGAPKTQEEEVMSRWWMSSQEAVGRGPMGLGGPAALLPTPGAFLNGWGGDSGLIRGGGA